MSSERRLDTGGSRADRAFFRVRALLPLRHEDVDAAEIENFVAALAVSTPDRQPPRELTLIDQLDRLEHKVDRVLSLLDPTFPRPLDASDQRPLEISGSGVRYPWPEPIEPGRLIRLYFSLPMTPPRSISCIGRVVSCREPDLPHRSYSLAVAFEHIAESDRDAIVRHTFQVEQSIRRSQDGPESEGEG